MKLQRNSLLALYSLAEFAGDPTRHISAAEIAHKYDVSPHHLAKVLAELARAGIVQSVRGVGGGYRFAANARRLTLLDVIARFEDVGSGAASRNGRTPADRALSRVLGEIDEMAMATLKSITLATLLRLMQHQPPGGETRPEAEARV
jgi:Rrf2 family protein